MNHSISTEDIRQKLLMYDLRVTHQRMAVYKLLYESREHPSAEVIHKKLINDYPALSLATVYKTLDSFAEKGLVRKLKSTDESVHYDADLRYHNHLFCTKTNKIIDYEDEEINTLIQNYFNSKSIDNFDVQEIRLNIFGEIKN